MTDGRSRLAACTSSAFVLMAGISGLRYTYVLFGTRAVSATLSTGLRRLIMAGALTGSCAAWPVNVVPAPTVRRLVPSWSISARSPA
jgi:hypothetical protein